METGLADDFKVWWVTALKFPQGEVLMECGTVLPKESEVPVITGDRDTPESWKQHLLELHLTKLQLDQFLITTTLPAENRK